MGLESQQVGDRGGAGGGWPGGKEHEGEGERVPPTRKASGRGSSWCLPQTLDLERRAPPRAATSLEELGRSHPPPGSPGPRDALLLHPTIGQLRGAPHAPGSRDQAEAGGPGPTHGLLPAPCASRSREPSLSEPPAQEAPSEGFHFWGV